jgi:hypothetical protein
MSLMQEAIWNYCRGLEDRAASTHVRNYRILGPLDIDILKKCLSYLTDRHEILRTTFGLVDGRPVQIIHESSPSSLSFVDLIEANDPEADSIFRQESSQEIDFEKLPIRRNVLIRVARDSYRLLRISHRLIIDGLASQILDAELAIVYEALLHGMEPPLPKQPPLQYADYAVWQREVIRPDGAYFSELMSWWTNLLATAPRQRDRRQGEKGAALPPIRARASFDGKSRREPPSVWMRSHAALVQLISRSDWPRLPR